jgi:hypothetical protein
MNRPSLMLALATLGVLAPLASSYAMPTIQAPGGSSPLVKQIACGPGYKTTSHDGCKLSHYAKKHPGQRYQEETDYYGNGRRDHGYYDNAPPRHHYHQHYYDNGDDGNY